MLVEVTEEPPSVDRHVALGDDCIVVSLIIAFVRVAKRRALWSLLFHEQRITETLLLDPLERLAAIVHDDSEFDEEQFASGITHTRVPPRRLAP